ncbi:MAG: hypothetical protein AAFX87_28565 [Bacteroidota bacterium]
MKKSILTALFLASILSMSFTSGNKKSKKSALFGEYSLLEVSGILNETYNVTVEEAPYGVTINNFFNKGLSVRAILDGGHLDIPEQSLSNELGYLGEITGYGHISENGLELTYFIKMDGLGSSVMMDYQATGSR